MDVPLIPREVLFGNPVRTSPRIAPDGRRLAWLAPDEGVLNVWVAPIDDFAAVRAVTRDRDRGVRVYLWAYDDRHLLYLQDTGGDEDWHVHAVDLEGGGVTDLTPFDGVQAQLVDVDRRFPDEVLLGLNRDDRQLHDLFRVDLRSGELTLVAKNPGWVQWLVDADWTMRGGVAPTEDGGLVVMASRTAGAEPEPVHVVGPDDALTTSPLGLSEDGTSLLLLTSLNANTSRLVRLDLSTNVPSSDHMAVLAEDPTYDVGDVLVHPDTREVQAIAFARERLEWQVLDDSVAADMAAVQALGRGDVSFLGRDASDETWLVALNPDDGPIRYFAHHRGADRAAPALFVHRPELEDHQLARMEPLSFTSRDGLHVAAYATFPVGARRAGLPTVLVVHGGPWARDHWGFNPEAQWLANRGYLCVQVNFRGSTGYGKDFLNAGNRAWGAEMHDDLLDAVDHVVGQGWADPAKVAIYGGSYGGYAALVGAAFTPERFACAVDIVGPSNLKTLIESVPPYWAPLIAQFHQRVGDPSADEVFLWSRSPLSRAADITIPLLIAQGANDPRVKVAESDQIVAALEERGIAHEYLLFPDEGHGFAKPENRLRFYSAAEAFLAAHLGGRSEAVASDG